MKWLADKPPADWPLNWGFPAIAWPPGYPHAFPADTHIVAALAHDLLRVKVYNEYGEEVPDLDGQLIQVHANQGPTLIRLRRNGKERWMRGGLFPIHGVEARTPLQLDKAHMIGEELTITVSVYGYSGGEITV